MVHILLFAAEKARGVGGGTRSGAYVRVERVYPRRDVRCGRRGEWRWG